MRVNHVASFIFICALAFSSPAHALAFVLAQGADPVEPYIGAGPFMLPLNSAEFLVATGTLLSVSAPATANTDLIGSEIFFGRLLDRERNVFSDCRTPKRTADEWGITHTAYDPHAPIVTFGPFTGTDCNINFSTTDPNHFIYAVVFRADSGQGEYGSFFQAMIPSSRRYSFTAYGVDATSTPQADSCASGGCVSNVLFLPGIEGSRLYYRGALGIEHQVWEPDLRTDIPYLEMGTDGTSKYQLYTKDIIDTVQAHNPLVSTIANIFGNNLETYGGFGRFMDSLVASSTLKEWRAYPYDWRYDVRDIVTNGTPTEMPDGSVQQVYLKEVLKEMVASSRQGARNRSWCGCAEIHRPHHYDWHPAVGSTKRYRRDVAWRWANDGIGTYHRR
jgi:hypothetical protein